MKLADRFNAGKVLCSVELVSVIALIVILLIIG